MKKGVLRLHLLSSVQEGDHDVRLRLSLIDSRTDAVTGPTEVLVDAPPDATFGEIRAQLTSLVNGGEDLRAAGDVEFEVGHRTLGDDAVLGLPPLLRGAVIVAARPHRSGMPSGGLGLADLRVVGGPGAGRTVSLGRGEHVLGRSTSCSVRLDDVEVSRAHCLLSVGDGEITVRDLQPANPSLLDDAPLPVEGAVLRPESVLRVGSTTLVLRQRSTPSVAHGIREGRVLVHARPRFARRAPRVEITTPEAPRRPEGTRLPLLASVAPLVLSGALALAMRSSVMLLFALMSPVLLIGQWWSDRRHGRLSHRRLLRQHRESLDAVDSQMRDALAEEVRQRRMEHPDLCLVLELVEARGTRLWERRPDDDDWLVLRLGTSRRPSRIVRAGAPVGEHPAVAAVPALVDLSKTAVVGVSGPREQCLALGASLVAQAAVWHSPRRMRVVLLTGGDVQAEDWAWARLLPHLLERQDGEIACEANVLEPGHLNSLIASLTAIVVQRTSGQPLKASGSAAQHSPAAVGDTLVVLDGARELRAVPGVADLLRLGPAAGMTFVCLAGDRASLPGEAVAVVELDRRGLRATTTLPDEVVTDVTLDLPGAGWLERVGRGLAPLTDATPEGQAAALPSTIGFRELHRATGFDPLDRQDLEAAWSRPAGAPRALLGVTTDGPHEIDLVRDGPHTLVGGTTGSGKSELLQALVVGLAATHRPDDLGFVLVDYKGGAAFSACARLPHTLGLVTDLDEHLTARALASLDAELRRRERVLAEAGAKDLEAFRHLDLRGVQRARLARLVIIVDEFKLLADELPDFVDGLVRIAAKGRSLGVHLVLATQRPAGIITGDMRSNVALRICLRVRDRSDSDDVINDPGAYTLTDLTPGRAYLRAGDGQLVALQTAHVGGPAEEPAADRRVAVVTLPVRSGVGTPSPEQLGLAVPGGLPERKRHSEGQSGPVAANPGAGVTGDITEGTTEDGPAPVTDGLTELAAFVDAARHVAESLGISPRPSPWLAPLPEWLGADGLADVASWTPGRAGHLPPGGGVPFGLVDRPHEQKQELACWDPEVDGHLGIIGGSRSGRTSVARTLVSALAQRRAVSELHVHVLESTPGPLGSLAELPHVGSVVGAADAVLVRRVVERMGEDLLGSATARPDLFVLVVDGWEAVEDALGSPANGVGADALLRLIRDGAPLGLRVIVTGGRAVGSGRLSSLLDRRLVLPMPDPLDLTLVGLEPSAARHLRGPGRAIDLADGSEVQIATVGSGPSPEQQVAGVHRLAASLRRSTGSPVLQEPWRIVPLPRLVCWSELRTHPQQVDTSSSPAQDGHEWVCLGVGGDDAGLTMVDVAGPARRLLVVGPPRSGRSNVLEVVARQLVARGRVVAVVAARRSPLQALASEPGVHLIPAGEDRRFIDLRRAHPDLAVLVDDAESVESSDLERALVECAGLAEESGGLIWASADTARANASFRGLIPAVAQDGSGIVLCPTAAADGDCLQARPDPVGRGIPGRGSLVLDSRCLPIQVARAAPTEVAEGGVSGGRHTAAALWPG
ncbi:S-DNA-T family DNA segregation ATPase FtsK/SpoIIIE [Humibacillus xanthopallidus]|uniref:S-DNA-T family DNA segregation ATPase FtsK/SpoIIIE n=1 Tax=Humibacillus xanthopallidus TaxID=412689 RepID=A0A543PX16_9MICO|nr:FtsK/SpoIIIE domain-containing protein [Humibacillus xanthopallidus]TQN48622.1 S-DNA-T family DNA segregation ATPase FtsK/SpoIIIE [Humibacillus xanthopallidus]